MTRKLKNGQSFFVQSAYAIQKKKGIVSCECKAWKMFPGPKEGKMCKHIANQVNHISLHPAVESASLNGVKKEKFYNAPWLGNKC